MAASLLLLLDDIASVLDDVSTMTKVAVKKTAGVLGDDLALNAKQVAGVSAARELPVVWAVARGSALNKLILVPAALAIGSFAPWAVTPLLMIGGAYLCYEGAEKILHRLLHGAESHHAPKADEPTKIAGAIRTDFILPADGPHLEIQDRDALQLGNSELPGRFAPRNSELPGRVVPGNGVLLVRIAPDVEPVRKFMFWMRAAAQPVNQAL
jgi:predicted DNA repair protein MutK